MADTLQIRTSQESQERFKKMAADLGLSQGAALDQMMAALQSQSIADQYPEKKGNVDSFQNSLVLLQTLYTEAIRNGEQQAELAKQKVQALLDSKDKTIMQLQREVEEAKEYQRKAEEAARKVEENEKSLEELRDQNRTLAEINAGLRENAADPKHVAELEKQVAVLQAQLEAKEEVIEALKLHEK